jgi:signal transduction histidine kinase/CheY-like chemotaxis protein
MDMGRKVSIFKIIRKDILRLLAIFLSFLSMILVACFFVNRIAEKRIIINTNNADSTVISDYVEALSSEIQSEIRLMTLILSILGFVFAVLMSTFIVQANAVRMRANKENKSKSSFLAQMSHEIRTPMNAILSLAEIVLRKNISKDVREHISIIKQSGITLLALINNILDFSKLEAGQLQLEVKKYEFASLLNDVINVIRMRLEGKSLEFLVNVDGNIPAQLEGDEIRIRQILINLLNNAVKYTKNGHISLDVSMEKYNENSIKLFFKVSDTGIGIKSKDIKLLFEEFTRVDTKSNEGIEGSGLGLAIVNNICKAMNGQITISSVYGQGSVFTAILVQGKIDDKKTAFVEESNKKRVLLYEESPLQLHSIMSAMNSLGVKPVCTPNIADFIKRLENGIYDFAFVPSRYAADCMPIWKKHDTVSQLIIMMKIGEIMTIDSSGSILLPVYTIPLAHIFNSVLQTDQTDFEDEPAFTAPNAYVLVVDDIETNLMVAEELLKFYEIQVDTSKSGAESLELIKKNRYDLIFMDHMMPEMDGVEVTAEIRKMGAAEPYYKKLPVVALTANALAGHREMFLKNGFNDFLAKPIEMDKLLVVLKEWIPKSKQLTADGSYDSDQGASYYQMFDHGLDHTDHGVDPSETKSNDELDLSNEQLEKLKAALIDLDIEVVNMLVMEYENLVMNSATKEFFEALSEDILLSEYENAVKRIDKVVKKGG